MEVAVRLQLPINGAAPALAPLGYKSGGRRVFAEAGVPMPVGREDLCTIDEVVRAALAVQAARPEARSVVVKLDNSASGVGNLVLDLPAADDPQAEQHLRGQLSGLPPWFVSELGGGCGGRGTHHRGRVRQPQRPGRHRARWPGHRPGDP